MLIIVICVDKRRCKKIDYINKLIVVQEIVDNGGDSDSELCRNCRYTDYGLENNCGQTNGGYWSCEGSGCQDAEDNVFDDIMAEYEGLKEELKLNKANMEIKIDLDVLESNLVKITTEKIEQDTINTLVGKIERKLEDKIEEKVNKMVAEKINTISEKDIYNLKVEIGDKEVSLFEYLISNMINKANEASVSFEKTIDEMTQSIFYNKVDDKYDEDEFKVLVKYGENEYGSTDSISVEINGRNKFSLSEGEPEDMRFGRNLNDALDIPNLIKEAYLAGKSGKIMYEAETVEEEC